MLQFYNVTECSSWHTCPVGVDGQCEGESTTQDGGTQVLVAVGGGDSLTLITTLICNRQTHTWSCQSYFIH